MELRDWQQRSSKNPWSSTTCTQGHNILSSPSQFPSPSWRSSLTHPQCPFFVIANVPLCDFGPENGSTEFWLGSHTHTSGHDQSIATSESTLANARLIAGEPETFVLPSVIEARRAIRPPTQPVCKKGDIMLRDLRTWHAGMPNESDDYRIMLALGYQVWLFHCVGSSC